MPELPEIQTIVDILRRRIPGRAITEAWLRPRSLYRKGSLSMRLVVGKSVADVTRLGKNVVLELDPVGHVLFNLGMTGRLIVGEAVLERALHAQLAFHDGTRLSYYDTRRFGFVFITEKPELRELLRVGPDPFEVKPRDLEKMLNGRKAPIKALLLNQRLVSGMGNIYTDEALHRAGIHPLTKGHEAAPHARRILFASRAVLRAAIRHGGSTIRDYRKTDGTRGDFQSRLAVYGKKGESCPRCGETIRKIVVASRGTHFCPRCQIF
ncbi:MAG: bifunctional DNA-formamidopyrimidine glycosylase/DNA-(apurinic or apyrimidinic site) lyase [Candidatus Latescibacteria bacterium]|nr:bifunctional DNA-formamidopyrimidine glycosylase/DNA-(apurinic or apyrimidinic site) lyase [Candidatus Latescibacterota bacterium]NIM66283.1 bifunctional DNA-formamidopyrimidine glycosylase/DNA-(apurinic or apyrimidinic site) lyase [Candidatus Latescibacterota bacterium]NIO02764.1 bifunctional DNA-formamidopyrimidine glycosylase/DNA-(apurinic or apyrimidinic site) lyase [Candidatus Latescibacterota bacterium]NIO29899.1 bifunctional DNA-formamidopyrimidine glycosylase/DNA-(apurinic or apyrimid